MKQPPFYSITNKQNWTLYVGATSDLLNRIRQHKEAITDGFTKKYPCKMLVFYENYENMGPVTIREKKIKAGSRKNKLKLIEDMNVEWKDLYLDIII